MAPDSGPADVLIVGGGYSGTMLAAELARRGVRTALIERSDREGRGTAYSTPEDAHLLNVVAGKMGAWADRTGHFAEAVASEGYQPDDYVPRRRYGEYLSVILKEAEEDGLVSVIKGEVVSAEPQNDGWAVILGDGARIEGAALALAQGNQAPQAPGFAADLPANFLINDPWSEDERAAVAKVVDAGGDVLIIGTGLTMVDVVLSLAEAGHQGRIVALSRRGLMPRPHAPHDAAPVEESEIPHGSLTRLWKWLRRQGDRVGWRAAVDSLRPFSHGIWQALDQDDRRRFLRHARPWWDVHRHRIAPEVADRIRSLVQSGQLQIVAGRILDMRADNGGLVAKIMRRRSGRVMDEKFSLAVNCTGPLGAISATRDPLLLSMFDAGLAKPDELELGLEVNNGSRINGAERAWAVGPLTKGRFWEITAVPDIRGQVARIADDIAKELKR